MQQSMNHTRNVVAEECSHPWHVEVVIAAQVIDHRGDDHRAVRGDAFTQRDSGAQVAYHGIQPVLVAAKETCIDDALVYQRVHCVDIMA